MEKTVYERSVELHSSKGKWATVSKVPLDTQDDLTLAYTPGVAGPCKEIEKDPERAWDLTCKGNTIAVISDGSAVLGLGNIGALPGLPVMEGKAVLFKKFAGIDAVPIMLDTQKPKKIIRIIKALAPNFGGINLEDISSPRCAMIENALQDIGIPVFHDDQHGTAIVVGAAMTNAVKLVRKKMKDITVVVSGTGAAGSAIIKMLKKMGVKEIYAFNIDGIVTREDYKKYHKDPVVQELSQITNSNAERLTLQQAMKKADAFIGVSAPKIVTPEMIKGMKEDSIVFAMANPTPEISFAEAKKAGAKVVGTGRSDDPVQINNLLVFPGVFKGALDCRATKISGEMKLAAVKALASVVSDAELREDYIIPKPWDKRVVEAISAAVAETARQQGIARI